MNRCQYNNIESSLCLYINKTHMNYNGPHSQTVRRHQSVLKPCIQMFEMTTQPFIYLN